MIEYYTKSPRTLIMLVAEAFMDPERVTAIGIAKEHDPQGERTLRIDTKFDSFDSNKEAKDRAVRWIRSTTSTKSGDDDSTQAGSTDGDTAGEESFELVLADDDDDDDDETQLCPHVLIYQPNGNDYSRDVEEAELHEKLGLPRNRSGATLLKECLPGVYASLIRSNIEPVAKTVREKLEEAKGVLAEVGRGPANRSDMIRQCQTHLRDCFLKYQEEMGPLQKHFTEEVPVRETESTVT
ncbi:unnamed protein product [Amoebophrya sp. A25]|nr:unnamed protein product [Amoebophrya sp. A25]|eukprot:GSA25T00004497001.1